MPEIIYKPRPAPLQNLQLFEKLYDTCKNTPFYLPHWGCFHGVAGYGKTTAAGHVRASNNCVLIECGSTWAAGTLVDALCSELLIRPKGGVSNRVQQIIRVLADNPVPMVFDEADHLVKKSLIDVIREIADKTQAPVIFIGEQMMPDKLKQFERAYSRVGHWARSVPCSMGDARLLVKSVFGKDGVAVSDDLLVKLLNEAEGSTRRLAAKLYDGAQVAKAKGLKSLTIENYRGEARFGEPNTRFEKWRQVSV